MSHFLNSTAQSLAQTLPIQSVELRVQNHTVVVKERLAEGGFGFVDLVADIHTKAEFVLKRCNVATKEALDIVQKEIKVLQKFEGPYIVKIIASDLASARQHGSSGGVEAFILLELCPGGHLLNRLNDRRGALLPASSIYRIFGQLLLAVKSLHINDPIVVHRDLKLENILFGSDGNVRLCDFGSCVYGHVPLRNPEERAAAEEVIERTTTQMYRSPEMVDLYVRDVLTEKTDIWALGCILYAICFQVHPFQDAGSLGILSAKIQIPASSSVSSDAHTILLRMLDVDPEARPTTEQSFQALTAIATGNPLPPYNLTPEAIQRRQEREDAAKKRDMKAAAKKNVAPALPQRTAPSQLDSNSVAARRLAAKNGVPLPPASTSKPPQPSSQPQAKPAPQPASTPTPPLQPQPMFDTSFANFSDTSFADFGDNSSSAFTPATTSKTFMPTSTSLVDFDGFEPSSSQTSKGVSHTSTSNNTTAAPVSASMFFDDDDDEPVHAASTALHIQSIEPSFQPSFDTLSMNDFDAFKPTMSSASSSPRVSPTVASSSVSAYNTSNNKSGHDWIHDFTAPSQSMPPAIPMAKTQSFNSTGSTKSPAKSYPTSTVDLLDVDDDSSTSSSTKSSFSNIATSNYMDTNTYTGGNAFQQRYGSSAADVMQMFDSPSKPHQLSPTSGNIMSLSSPVNMPQSTLSAKSSITTMNPAYGRTSSAGNPPANPFASNMMPTNIMNPASLHRASSLGSSAYAQPLGGQGYGLNMASPARGIIQPTQPKDPFDTLNSINPYSR